MSCKGGVALAKANQSYTTENTREKIPGGQRQGLSGGRGGKMNREPGTGGLQPQSYEAWEQTAKELIEIEMMRRGIRYKQLSRLLEGQGIYETPDQINRKVNRKRFSAAFLVVCLCAMGVETLSLK
ncbi:DUF6471 domain-containing protein [Paludibacterium sp.]|uniref:DUF6471 domain-containing protein n=1 Tax=Paludibacterium sp. TaxID=1917523 RepID=UPI0034563BD0